MGFVAIMAAIVYLLDGTTDVSSLLFFINIACSPNEDNINHHTSTIYVSLFACSVVSSKGAYLNGNTRAHTSVISLVLCGLINCNCSLIEWESHLTYRREAASKQSKGLNNH